MNEPSPASESESLRMIHWTALDGVGIFELDESVILDIFEGAAGLDEKSRNSNSCSGFSSKGCFSCSASSSSFFPPLSTLFSLPFSWAYLALTFAEGPSKETGPYRTANCFCAAIRSSGSGDEVRD